MNRRKKGPFLFNMKFEFEEYENYLFNQGQNHIEEFLSQRLPNLFYNIEISREKLRIIVRVPKLSINRICKDIQKDAPDYYGWFLVKAIEDEF